MSKINGFYSVVLADSEKNAKLAKYSMVLILHRHPMNSLKRLTHHCEKGKTFVVVPN